MPSNLGRHLRPAALAGAALVIAAVATTSGTVADEFADCSDGSPATKIVACTEVLKHEDISAKTRSNALMNRSMARQAFGEENLAVRDLNEAIAVWPGNGSAYFNRGQAHFTQGAFDLAIPDYHAAILLDPRAFLPKWRLAEAYCRLGLTDLSRSAWTNVLSVDKHAIIRLQTDLHDMGRFSAVISGEMDRWTFDALDRWISDKCHAAG